MEPPHDLAGRIPQIVWTATADGAFDYYNERWYQITGLARPASVPPERPKASLHPEDYDAWLKAWRTAVESGSPFEHECRLWDALQNDFCWHLERAMPAKDGNGAIERWFGTLTDIHERKTAGQEERRFRAIVEASPSAIVLVDPGGRLVLVNSQTEKLFGYDRAEMLGQPVELLWAAGGKACNSLDEQSRQSLSADADIRWRRKDGFEFAVEVALTAVPLHDGPFLLASISDVTERRRANELARMLQSLVSGVKDYAIYMLTPEGIISSWNSGAEHIKGYSAQEAIGQHFSIFYQPEEIAEGRPEEGLRRALAEGKHAEEGWRVRRDGSRFWASVIITPISDHRGRHRGFSKITHDITARKATEIALRRSEREFRLLADAIPQIVWMADAQGRPFYYNRRWYEFNQCGEGAGNEDFPTLSSWTPILHPDEVEGTLNAWRDAVTSGNPFNWEYRLWHRGGQVYRWHLAKALPVRDESGRITRWFATATDIHEQKAATERLDLEVRRRTDALSVSLDHLKTQEETLRESLIEKDVLLREIHHRVKNNLQIISSLLSMQAANIEDDGAVAQLMESERRVRSMALIHEQLYSNENMSSIDFAEYVRRLVPVILSSYGQTTALNSKLNLCPMNLTIEQAIPCGLILNELLSNSLKYAYPNTPNGEIHISLAVGPDWMEMSVRDKGVGLPPGFHTGATKTLGLKIVQVLTKQLQGQMETAGSPGASFTLRFPARIDRKAHGFSAA